MSAGRKTEDIQGVIEFMAVDPSTCDGGGNGDGPGSPPLSHQETSEFVLTMPQEAC